MPFPRARQAFWSGALTLAAGVGCSHAAGLGPIEVQSSLGQQLRASISIIGADTNNQVSSCVKAKVESLDGVISIAPRIGLVRTDRAASIRLTTRENINEPALNIQIELGCDVSVRRTYQVLLDPVLALPTVQRTPQPASSVVAAPRTKTVEAQTAPMPSAIDANLPARLGKSRKNPEKSLEASVDSALVAPQATRSKPAAKVKPARRSVLRISPVDEPTDNANIALRLKFSNTLSMPADGVASPNPAETTEVLDPIAMAARTEELIKAAEMLRMKALQAESDALKTENTRIKQQSATDKAALVSIRDELLIWVKGLGLILFVCLAAIGWLAWRFNAIRKKQYQASWNEFFSEFGPSARREENSAFNDIDINITDSVTAVKSEAEPQQVQPPSHSGRSAAPAGRTRDAPSVDRVNVPPVKYSRTSLNPFILSNRTGTAPAGGNDASELDASHKEEASLKAEEISDVMELVDAWMALHEPAKVLELLEPFKNVDHPKSPLPWLCLLNVYSTLHDRKKYEAILRRITTLFNVKLAPWETRSDNDRPRTLADFPHVVTNIFALWNSDDISPYLESLLVDNRDGARNGFDLPVYRDIARLATLARDPARPRQLDQFKHVKAYSVLFAEPTSEAESGECPAPMQDAREGKPAEASAKPPLRERPKYITTSYQRKVTDKDSAEDKPAIAGNKLADEAKPAHLRNDAASAKPEIRKPVVAAAKSDNAAVAKKTFVANTTAEATQTVATAPIKPAVAAERVAGKQATARPAYSKKEESKAAVANNDMSPMAIKLHLAIAYQDIGDIEGACLLLDEVINDGSPEQCQQARLLLAELG
jgi:FimV-like protein